MASSATCSTSCSSFFSFNDSFVLAENEKKSDCLVSSVQDFSRGKKMCKVKISVFAGNDDDDNNDSEDDGSSNIAEDSMDCEDVDNNYNSYGNKSY